MKPDPIVVREDERGWEVMRAESTTGPRGVLYKTLISGGLTRSDSLTLGMAKISPESALSEHRHRQAEVYLVLAGEGWVRVDGTGRPGDAALLFLSWGKSKRQSWVGTALVVPTVHRRNQEVP